MEGTFLRSMLKMFMESVMQRLPVKFCRAMLTRLWSRRLSCASKLQVAMLTQQSNSVFLRITPLIHANKKTCNLLQNGTMPNSKVSRLVKNARTWTCPLQVTKDTRALIVLLSRVYTTVKILSSIWIPYSHVSNKMVTHVMELISRLCRQPNKVQQWSLNRPINVLQWASVTILRSLYPLWGTPGIALVMYPITFTEEVTGIASFNQRWFRRISFEDSGVSSERHKI